MVHQKLFKVSEVEISYKPNHGIAEKPKIKGSNDAYNILMDHWDEGKIELLEEFKILLINRGNKVLGVVNISSGGVSGTIADPKIIFAAALKCCASGIILAHNHPSGEITPSIQDREITRKLQQGGKLLDIDILDHLIVTFTRYYSFADDGAL